MLPVLPGVSFDCVLARIHREAGTNLPTMLTVAEANKEEGASVFLTRKWGVAFQSQAEKELHLPLVNRLCKDRHSLASVAVSH